MNTAPRSRQTTRKEHRLGYGTQPEPKGALLPYASLLLVVTGENGERHFVWCVGQVNTDVTMCCGSTRERSALVASRHPTIS